MRQAYELATGTPLPRGTSVYRACGRYACLNPRHLRAGKRGEVVAAIDRIRAFGPTCRVDALPERPAPMHTHAAPARVPRRLPPGTCSYCGHTGGGGTATVCGTTLPCPACSAPEWPELVAKYGADHA